MRAIDLRLSRTEVFRQILPLRVAAVLALESQTLVYGWPLLAVFGLSIIDDLVLLSLSATDKLDLLTLPTIVVCTSVSSRCISST